MLEWGPLTALDLLFLLWVHDLYGDVVTRPILPAVFLLCMAVTLALAVTLGPWALLGTLWLCWRLLRQALWVQRWRGRGRG